MKQSSSLSLLWGLLGLSLVIFVHELGHFVAAKLCGVAVPTFSIGFGPQLFALTLGKTTFQLALLPLGGYVHIAEHELAQQPYLYQVVIMLAGIAFNVIFAYLIFLYLAFSQKKSLAQNTDAISEPADHTPLNILINKQIAYMGKALNSFLKKKNNHGVTGPIGIIDITRQSSKLGARFFFFVLAVLSLNIAFFNILPLPFLDGGKIALISLEKVIGPLNRTLINTLSYIFLFFALMMLMLISMRDIRNLRIKK